MNIKALIPAITVAAIISPVWGAAANPTAGTDFALRSNKAFYPPQVENDKLNKRVSFVFQKTRLSEILMMLSKAANFDIVLPEGLDHELSVTISDKRIIDAIKEVIEIAKYRYKFQNNTLIISEIDIGEAEFEHIQIHYEKASNITRALNEDFFKQIILNQSETAVKPYAFTNPGQNSITIVGNPSQIEAARALVKTLDTSKEINFYKTGFLDIEDVNYLLGAKLESPSIEAKEVTGAIALKGQGVNEAIKLLKDYDKPRKPINFYVEVLRIDIPLDSGHQLKEFEQFFPYGKLQKISSSLAETTEFTSIADYLYRESSDVFLLGAREEKALPGMRLSARRDLLNDKQYSLKAFGEKLEHIDKDDIVGFMIKGSDLIPDAKELFRLLKVQPDANLLILIQQQ